jgi:hypothetical protein
MNIWQKITGIYYQPSKVFEQLKPKTLWWVPFIILLAVSVAVMFITRPVVVPEIMDQMAKNPDIPAESLPQVQERIQNPLYGLLGVLVGMPLVWVAIGLVFWGIFSMLGGKSSFGPMFAATAWAGMVSIPGSLIKVPLMFAMETAKVHTSLALILPPDMDETYIFRLLAQIDIFTIWTLAVMALGYSVFTGIKQKKSLWAVFIAWSVWALVISAVKGMGNMAG